MVEPITMTTIAVKLHPRKIFILFLLVKNFSLYVRSIADKHTHKINFLNRNLILASGFETRGLSTKN